MAEPHYASEDWPGSYRGHPADVDLDTTLTVLAGNAYRPLPRIEASLRTRRR
ncbi:MAG TPA: hypothetical protein VKY90_10380 [Candidatus Dormibacteraeota bacterium]|nr:hypothetical protein [Candidatus Dormibacteraeota bacterium]